MATPNLSIKNDWALDIDTTRAAFNSPADLLDWLSEWFEQYAGHGTRTGWQLQSNKTVTAGNGFVNHGQHATGSAASVTGWTNGVVNYVNCQPNITTDAAGNKTFGVSFVATTSSVVPSGSIPIASVTLDSSGTVTGDISHARQTNAWNYQWTELVLSVSREGVAAGATVYEVIPLGDTLYGGYTVDLTSAAGFTARSLDCRTTQFTLQITNDTAYPATLNCTATVRGQAGV